jgi:hypothetical protein
MKKLKTGFASTLTLCLIVAAPLNVSAQVTDLPAGPYGGEFRDERTGKVWLDYDVTLGKKLSEKIAFLANTPFRLATAADLQSIAQQSFLQDPATGPYSACVSGGMIGPQTCKDGVFDDSTTGTNPNLAGLIFVEQAGTGGTIENDRVDEAGAALFGAWAIQRGPALHPGTSPFGADFDGDGKDEKIVWRPSEGNWYIRFSATDEAAVYQWGLPGDIPLVGDYDGDLIPDLVVWRPSNGTWYVKTSSSLYDASQAIQQQFGLPGDVPTKADFDGDGKLDFAVWRPSEGNWYVLQSSNHQVVVTQWGLSRDIPVTGGRDH